LPPKSDVMRRMNVDLPHPESAARPMITGPSRAARVTVLTRAARVTGDLVIGVRERVGRVGGGG
jgi:hypothetical protein